MKSFAVACALASPSSAGNFLRSGVVTLDDPEGGNTALDEKLAEIPTHKEIAEKWDKMDDFLKVMFTLGCKAKHGKDIVGVVKEKIQKEEHKDKQIVDLKKVVHEQNLKSLKKDCDKIVWDGKAQCRENCRVRWTVASKTKTTMDKRTECDHACVKSYDSFGKNCLKKAADLENIYKEELELSEARDRCYTGFCKPFPTVWELDKEKGIAERDKRCEARCTEDAIAATCTQRWVLKVDFKVVSTKEECFEEGKAKECFEKKSGKAKEDHAACEKESKGKCASDETACIDKGVLGKDVCTSTKKDCDKQATATCLSDHKKALDEGKEGCEKDDEVRMNVCREEKMGAEEDKFSKDCLADMGKNCPSQCKDKCIVEKLVTCREDLKSDHDPTGDFCGEFWDLLHDSSEIDPSTGNRIVLF